MSKKYENEGKLTIFNFKRFSELVDAKAKELQCAKIWIFKEIASHLNVDIDDNVNKIYRWYKGLNAPVDMTIIKDVSVYFGIDYNQLLIVKEKGKKKMDNINNTQIVAPLKKVQQYELLRVKDVILDYIYDNYTSAFWEDYMFAENGGCSIPIPEVDKLLFRLMEKQGKSFDAKNYFSDEEMEKITKEREIESKALKSKIKKKPDVSLLDEYRELCENGKMYELIRSIERSLAVLPFELVNRIMTIINILPDGRDYLNGLCAFGSSFSYQYSSFDDVLEPDFCLDVPDVDSVDMLDENVKKNSTYNIVMNVYKELNELINKYCD